MGPDTSVATPDPRDENRLVLWAYRLFPVLLLPLMLVLSRDFGITWDERTHQQYGQRVWAFLAEGKDNNWFRPGLVYMYLHGGLFDALCIGAEKVLKGDLWTNRHYVNAFFGWLGVVSAGGIGRMLGGAGTGLLAMVLLVVSPRFFADAMANPKDIPFAALATATLYFLLRLDPRYPFLRWPLAIPTAVSIGLALNVRAGAVLFLAYLALALGALTLARRELSPRRLAATGARWLVVSVAALFIGSAFWPWARGSPLTRPFEAVRRLSEFDWTHHLLYNGADITGDTLPWDYVPRWALIGTPPVVLLGAALALLMQLHPRTRGRWRLLAVWGATLFPAVYVVVSHATIYDGIRHLLFTYLPLVTLAAWAWTRLLGSRTKALRLVAAGALILGLLEPVVFQWRNHPHQAVYFNFIVGGPRGAFGRFEMDYWGVSVRDAVQWVGRTADAAGTPLVVSGHPHQIVRDESRRVEALDYSRIEKLNHHVEVVLLRGPRADVIELAERTDALYRVSTADGTPLTVVVPGPRYGEVEDALGVAFKRAPRDVARVGP
jgi:hypothetical protein